MHVYSQLARSRAFLDPQPGTPTRCQGVIPADMHSGGVDLRPMSVSQVE